MMRKKSGIGVVVMGALLALAASGCNEANRNTSPVEMVASATVLQSSVDIASPPAANALATVLLSTFIKNTAPANPTDPRFLDVRITAYRVSYIRTDGGTLVPQPFTVSSGQVIPSGSANVPLDNFQAFQPGALSQAPFAALLPNNGGVDPQTGRRNVGMDVRVEVFGETLSGQNVYATTRFPVTFTYGS